MATRRKWTAGERSARRSEAALAGRASRGEAGAAIGSSVVPGRPAAAGFEWLDLGGALAGRRAMRGLGVSVPTAVPAADSVVHHDHERRILDCAG